MTGPETTPVAPVRRSAPELLAPAGDCECARAAVENGADGIYFGLERFNARMRASNFTVADLPELMAYLHRRGVKGYVTFNTLVFADELAEAEAFLRAIIAAGVDAPTRAPRIRAAWFPSCRRPCASSAPAPARTTAGRRLSAARFGRRCGD